MRKRLLPATCGLLLIVLGCDLNNGILQRAADSYFPLVTNWEWTYRYSDGTTSIVKVRGDSAAYNYPCTVVENDFQEQYWIIEHGQVRRFVNYKVNVGGTDYPLEQRYRQYYILPFITGNAWAESFTDTVDVLGESIAFSHNIRGQVARDTVISVPAGQFRGCYEVDLTEVVIGLDADTTFASEWYAPGIGLVRRVQGETVQELESYQIP
jgi:hypothetical protein